MDMIVVWALSWWYGSGWKAELYALGERLSSSYDYFSIGILGRTLFAPYKQISASSVRGPLNVRFRAFVDRLISRVIGAVVRSLFIVVGIGWLAIQATLGSLKLLAWPFVPLGPVLGFIAFVSGWTPTWM